MRNESALVLLPPLVEQPRMVVDEVMQVFVSLFAQLSNLSEPEQEYGASPSHLAVPRQLAPTEVVDPPDAIDLPDLEVGDLDDVWPGVGREGYRAVEEYILTAGMKSMTIGPRSRT